jgi:hypothetical protein
VQRKPFGDRFRQHRAVARLARGDAVAHFSHHLQHAPVLGAMAGERRKVHRLHPALLLPEMRLGMGDERVEPRQQLALGGGAEAVEELDELAVRVVHGGLSEPQRIRPFEQGHRASLRSESATAYAGTPGPALDPAQAGARRDVVNCHPNRCGDPQ